MEILAELNSLTPKLQHIFIAGARTQIVTLNKLYDWYNGFYLHMSGRGSADLLHHLMACTYTIKTFQEDPVTVGQGEILCVQNGYGRSAGCRPQFPSMDQVTASFPTDVEHDSTSKFIPLLLNLYGSELGPGIPTVALIYHCIFVTFNLNESIESAISNGDIQLQFVALENGLLESGLRLSHAGEYHTKQSPTVDSSGAVNTCSWRIGNGVVIRL